MVLMLGLTARAGDPPAAGAAPAAAAPIPIVQSEPPPINLTIALQNNDGSLLRAQTQMRALVESQSPPGTASAENRVEAAAGSATAVSFFAVAPQRPKTYRKHDLISIIARELSAFTSNGSTTETKTQDLDDKLNAFIALRPSLLQLHSVISGGTNVPEINIANSRDYKGTGEVDRTDTFTDRFTAEVVDVRPNGTMVLQAIKQIKNDEELQRMILTGICRVEDVSPDNTVLTTQLFDLELHTIHTGAVTDSTKRGFLPRLLDTFSPF
jgi:flagellar L-ring protein precursor FlgH